MANRNRKARFIGPKLRTQTPPTRPDWGATTPTQFKARQAKAVWAAEVPTPRAGSQDCTPSDNWDYTAIK